MSTRFLTLPLILVFAACSASEATPAPTAPTQQSAQTTAAAIATRAPAATAAPPAVVTTAPATAEPAATETSAPAAAPLAAAPIGDASELIKGTLRKQLISGPFRNKTTIVADGLTITGSGEFIPPNRLRVKSEVGGQKIEQVHIDGRSWAKVGDAWRESKTQSGPLSGLINAEFVEAMLATVTEPKLIGPELLDGRAVIVVSYVADMTKAPGYALPGRPTVKLWIGAADGLLYKQEIADDTSTTTQVIEYDPSISIEPPG